MEHIQEINIILIADQFLQKKLENAFNQGEIDGIKSGLRKNMRFGHLIKQGLSKSDLLKIGLKIWEIQFLKHGVVIQIQNNHCGSL